MQVKNKTQTDTFLRVLRHPVRAEVVSVLQTGPASASEIARWINEPARTVSYHLRKLEEQGLVSIGEIRARGSVREKFYTLRLDLVIEKSDWEKLPPLARERIGSSISLTMLGDLSRAVKKGIVGERDSSNLFDAFPVDPQGMIELQEISESTVDRLAEVYERSKARLADSGEDGVRMSFLLSSHRTPTR